MDQNQNFADAATQTFLNDVIQGLSRDHKQLQCKYFYDQRGSQLFDQICQLDEYYLTRIETAIMSKYVGEMAYQIGSRVMLVEFGSGSSTKTRILLEELDDPVAYVPFDISEEHLLKTAAELRRAFPTIEILPIVGDFTKSFQLPKSSRPASHAAVYFPGSTIGNFTPDAVQGLLRRIANILGPQGGLLIGIDLKKDPAVIHAAYNDSKGVTDEFNLNVLHRVNRELGADFDVSLFRHKAIYNEPVGRVEIFVVSLADQTVNIDGHSFHFAAGEHVLTEYSHKYTVAGFAELAAVSGFALHKYWTDDRLYFAVLHLVNTRQ
jgi:dimethylhistidine N-methyltransferase